MWKFIVDVVHDFVSSFQPDVGQGFLHVSNVFLFCLTKVVFSIGCCTALISSLIKGEATISNDLLFIADTKEVNSFALRPLCVISIAHGITACILTVTVRFLYGTVCYDTTFHKYCSYGSGHEGAAILLPGFAIKWKQNQVTRQPHFRDLTHMLYIGAKAA